MENRTFDIPRFLTSIPSLVLRTIFEFLDYPPRNIDHFELFKARFEQFEDSISSTRDYEFEKSENRSKNVFFYSYNRGLLRYAFCYKL